MEPKTSPSINSLIPKQFYIILLHPMEIDESVSPFPRNKILHCSISKDQICSETSEEFRSLQQYPSPN